MTTQFRRLFSPVKIGRREAKNRIVSTPHGAAFGEKGGEIPWRRVWRLPPHVFFSHRSHVVAAGVKCQTCHGPMETLDRPPGRPLKQLAMSDCIGCHEQWRWPDEGVARGAELARVPTARRVSTDCNACHR